MILLPLFAFLLLLSLSLLSTIPIVGGIVPLIGSLLGFLILLGIFIEDLSKYNKWTKTRHDQPVSDEKIRELIEKGVITPCTYHPTRASIAICNLCGIELCIRCLKIKSSHRGGLFAELLCVYHHWLRQRRFLRFYSVFLLILLLLALSPILILTPPSQFGTPFFQLLCIALSLPFLLLLAATLFSSLKLTRNYQQWQKEVGFTPNK